MVMVNLLLGRLPLDLGQGDGFGGHSDDRVAKHDGETKTAPQGQHAKLELPRQGLQETTLVVPGTKQLGVAEDVTRDDGQTVAQCQLDKTCVCMCVYVCLCACMCVYVCMLLSVSAAGAGAGARARACVDVYMCLERVQK